MNIKRAVSNLIILLSTGSTTVCTEEKFLKIRVFRFAKNGFLRHFLLVIYSQTKPIFISKYSLNNGHDMHHRCICKTIVRVHP